MTLFFRLLQIGIASLFQKRLSDFGEAHEATFRVLPSDLDIFVHMNNAKYLNYMEVARWGIVFRAGFFWKSLWKGRMLPIAKIDIRYLRPLKFWQEFTVSARIINYSERWIYVHHVFTSRDKMVCQALSRSAVVSKTEGLLPPRVFLENGMRADQVHVPDEIRAWFEEFSREAHGRAPKVDSRAG